MFYEYPVRATYRTNKATIGRATPANGRQMKRDWNKCSQPERDIWMNQFKNEARK